MGWPPFTIVKRMVLKINKSDYERLIGALEVAKDIEANANRKRLISLTKKKIARQGIYELRKANNKRKNSKQE